ncbi:MAG: hypothetical protein Kow0069_11190 [Promethearchaeota archaeon]
MEPNDAQSSDVTSWWNESYQFRVRVDQEDVAGVSFDPNTCNENSTRVVKY